MTLILSTLNMLLRASKNRGLDWIAVACPLDSCYEGGCYELFLTGPLAGVGFADTLPNRGAKGMVLCHDSKANAERESSAIAFPAAGRHEGRCYD